MTDDVDARMPVPVTPEELEFLAAQEAVTIVPSFSISPDVGPDGFLHTGSVSVGPVRPNMQVDCPLWLALMLKRRNKCDILPPAWLSAAFLSETLQSETQMPGTFQELPEFYVEISQLLLYQARGIFGGGDESFKIIDLVNRLRQLRAGKIQDGLKKLVAGGSSATVVKLNNLAAAERNMVRTFLAGGMDMFQELAQADRLLTQGTQSQY